MTLSIWRHFGYCGLLWAEKRSSRCDGQEQTLMAPHEQTRHPFGRRTVCQAHVLALLEQHCECDLCFQSSKSGADAEVGSLAESQMRAKIWPSDVQDVRIREGGRI